MTSRPVRGAVLAIALGAGLIIPITGRAGPQAPTLPGTSASDWPQWRGPNRDAVIPAFSAPARWPDTLTPRWKVDVGLGYATPLVVGNRVFMWARQGDNEVMTALDAGTGRVLWRTGAPAIASTVLMPTVRSSVLLPDMFEPLTTSSCVGGTQETSLGTTRAAGISGWPSPRPSKRPMRVVPVSSTISGNGSSGCSKRYAESDEKASSSPAASIHSG